MARDVAEFLWKKFSNSLQEAESELSGSISISYLNTSIKNLISQFKEIKNAVNYNDIMPSQPYSDSPIIPLLYDLNDELAECRFFAHKCKELNKKLLIFNPFTYYFIHKMKNRLVLMKVNLEQFAAERQEKNESHYLPAKSEPINRSTVFGFHEQVNKTEGLLFGGASSRNVIGVVGIAGVGKTTLVQKVLESPRVKDKFSPIVWLPFSGMREGEQQFSRVSFETCFLDNLGQTVDGRIVGLPKLHERLNQLLSDKRYLIVLDDVQRRHINILDRLWRGLPKGSGGTVIVTSRLTEVAEKLTDQNNLIHVKPLDREICWGIFQETIKKDWQVPTISHRQALENIEEEIKDQCHGLPLAAKALAEIIPEQIREIESNRFFKEMYIPDELLKPDLDAQLNVHIPSCPVLVFIDMKNEPHGERLFDQFCYRLNKKQVFAVLEESSDSKKKVKAENPGSVLKEVYGTLEKLKRKEYRFAYEIQKSMRIIIVGGDSVANWILGVICDLKLPEIPSIVPIPQETENNIPRSFGWRELNTDRSSVSSFLNQLPNAELMKTDSWHILIKMNQRLQSSTAQQDRPRSLNLFCPVDDGSVQNEDNSTLHGGFWNYFSLGVDAPRGYGANCFHPTSRTLNSLASVRVTKNGQSESLKIPRRIKTIVCLNLPSFLGELNPWGTASMKKDQESHLTQSFVDDGHLEIIGLKDVLLFQNERICLDQVQEICFEFTEGAAEFVNIGIDGAPWKKVPLEGIKEIKISCRSKVNILANGDCPAKRHSHNSSQPSASGTDDNNNAKDSSTGNSNNAKDISRANVKFGPTDTFKIP